MILSETLLTLFSKGNHHLTVKSIRKSLVNNYFNIMINRKYLFIPWRQRLVLKNKVVRGNHKLKLKDQFNDLLKLLHHHHFKVNILIFHSILMDPLLIINYIQFQVLKKRTKLFGIMNRIYKLLRNYMDLKEKQLLIHQWQYFFTLFLFVEIFSLFHFYLLNWMSFFNVNTTNDDLKVNTTNDLKGRRNWSQLESIINWRRTKLKSSVPFINNDNQIKKWHWDKYVTYRIRSKGLLKFNHREWKRRMFEIYKLNALKKQSGLPINPLDKYDMDIQFRNHTEPVYSRLMVMSHFNYVQFLLTNPTSWYIQSIHWHKMFYLLKQTNKLRSYFSFFFSSKLKWKKWSRKQKYKIQFEDIIKTLVWKRNRLKMANLKRKNKLFYFWIIQSTLPLIQKRIILHVLYKNTKMLHFVVCYFESIFYLQNWLEKHWLKHQFMQNLILNELKLYNLNHHLSTTWQGFRIKLKGPIRMKKLDRSKTLLKMYGTLNLSNPEGSLVEYKTQIWTKLGTVGAHLIIH